jgi:uncharacterized protein
MQSNLLLWEGSFAAALPDLLAKGAISTSVEPPGDAPLRRVKGGQTYFDAWWPRMKEVRDCVGGLSAVCVVDRNLLSRVEESYFFFKNMGVSSLRFNPMYPVVAGRSTSGAELSSEEWGEFLVRLLHVWNNDGREFPVEPLRTWAGLMRGRKQPGACDITGRCADRFLGVDPVGDIYQCGRAMDAQVLRYGNVADETLEEILEAEDRLRLQSRQQVLRESQCAGCSWWGLCHGGCPIQAHLQGDDIMSRTPWCEGRRQVFAKMAETGTVASAAS